MWRCHRWPIRRLHADRVCLSQIYAFWVEPKNYVDVTRSWYAEHLPFPLNFFLPGRMQRHQLDKLRLLRGDESLEAGEEVEKEVRRPRSRSPGTNTRRRHGLHNRQTGRSQNSLLSGASERCVNVVFYSSRHVRISSSPFSSLRFW